MTSLELLMSIYSSANRKQNNLYYKPSSEIYQDYKELYSDVEVLDILKKLCKDNLISFDNNNINEKEREKINKWLNR